MNPEPLAREKIITTMKLANPHWKRCTILCGKEVEEFFKGSKNLALLQKVAFYILAYVENTVDFVFDLLEARSEERARRYLEFMKPSIERLRELYREVHKSKDAKKANALIREMISICLDIGIDPF